jgi:hypothetical protein
VSDTRPSTVSLASKVPLTSAGCVALPSLTLLGISRAASIQQSRYSFPDTPSRFHAGIVLSFGFLLLHRRRPVLSRRREIVSGTCSATATAYLSALNLGLQRFREIPQRDVLRIAGQDSGATHERACSDRDRLALQVRSKTVDVPTFIGGRLGYRALLRFPSTPFSVDAELLGHL